MVLAGENHKNKKWLPPFYKYFFFILIWRQSVLPAPSCPYFHFVWAFLTHNFLLVFYRHRRRLPLWAKWLQWVVALSAFPVALITFFISVLLRQTVGESNSRPVYGGFSYETEKVLSSWTWILSVCVYLRSVCEEGVAWSVGNSSSRLPFPV